MPRPSRKRLPKNPGRGLFTAAEGRFLADRFNLSARELGVARLMFEGKTRAQIARQLQCAPGTVRIYIDRLFVKLNVEDRLAMALRVVRVLHEASAS